MSCCKNSKCRIATNKVNDDLCPECRKKIKWIAILSKQTVTMKIAYGSSRNLALALEEQTRNGWVVIAIYQSTLTDLKDL